MPFAASPQGLGTLPTTTMRRPPRWIASSTVTYSNAIPAPFMVDVPFASAQIMIFVRLAGIGYGTGRTSTREFPTMAEADPFVHHPELRDKILDPLKSFFRTFLPSDMDARMEKLGIPPTWRLTDEEREASRQATLEGRKDGDLWVFAYGSLMWDPAFRFAEVRRAHVEGYARQFILRDTLGGRGTRAAPGLMAALDEGPGCHGLLYRIAADHVDEETEILWRREKIAFAYIPRFVTATTALGRHQALAFVADHRADYICPDLPRDDRVRYLATGAGFLGSSLEYIRNLDDHFQTLGIEDEDVSSLLRDAEAYGPVRADRN